MGFFKRINKATKTVFGWYAEEMSWFLPTTLGLIALVAICDDSDKKEVAPKEETTETEQSLNKEETTKEETPVEEESNEDVQETEQCGDENLKEYESTLKEE